MTTWTWGLRRYAWIVALFVIGIGILVPVALSRTPDVYEAQAQVGPTTRLVLPNLDPLPRFAQSVFNDGAVASDVRDLMGLAPDASVIPGTVELSTAQDNPVMVIRGKASSPEGAAAAANQAGATFVVELNKYSDSVGTFAIQHEAVAPGKPAPKVVGGNAAPLVGVLAGLVAGAGAVGLVLVLRRPVVGAAAAEAATGLPVLGTLTLRRNGSPDQDGLRSLGALSRRLLAREPGVVYVTGSVQSHVDQVATALAAFLSGPRPTTPGPAAGVGAEYIAASEPPGTEVFVLEASSDDVWIPDPSGSFMLLVVPQGVTATSLRRLAEPYAADDGAVALVTVRRRGIRWVPWRSRKAALASQPG